MSREARDWAYSVDLPICQKFVLVALAERANDEALAWPSVQTISGMTGACERSVRYALKQLQKSGLIICLKGNSRSKTYRLSFNSQFSIPARDAACPASLAPKPAADAPARDATYPARDAGKGARDAGLTGKRCTQTVKNRKEPVDCTALGDEKITDWANTKWMALGNEILDITGQDPARCRVDFGVVRQWLSDAQNLGYGFETARATILATVREKCERGSGLRKVPMWFNVPVSDALRSGIVAPSQTVDATVERPVRNAYSDHIMACAKAGIKRKSFEQFSAEWAQGATA